MRSIDATLLGEPIVARGVMLDVAALHGVDHLAPDHGIGAEELEACEARQRVRVGAGDVLLVRTGWLKVFELDEDLYHRQQPGITTDAVPWLVERDVAAVGADNGAVERLPDPSGHVRVHQLLLRDYGVHLMELLVLDELGADRVSEFLFVAAPLRIKRAAGSPLNPVAIV